MKNKTNLSNATKTTIKQNFLGYLYLLPTLIITLIFVVYPLVMSFRMGFYERYNYYTDEGSGFGLSTFQFVLTDANFQKALMNTFLIVVIAVPVSMIIALAIALLLNSGIKASKFFQAIYFLPYVTSVIAIGIVWSWLFHSDFGYINQFLGLFGVQPIQWLNDPKMAIWALIIFNIWSGLAFKIVIFLSQDVEASADDTVNRAIGAFLSTQDLTARALFIQRYFYMEKISVLSKKFGLKESTVSTKLNRTRLKLKQYLEREGIVL